MSVFVGMGRDWVGRKQNSCDIKERQKKKKKRKEVRASGDGDKKQQDLGICKGKEWNIDEA